MKTTKTDKGPLAVPWDKFLNELEIVQCGISTSLCVKQLCAELQKISNLPLPIAHRTNDGSVQFAWRYKNALLEIDILPSGKMYWFGFRRDSGFYEEGDVDWESELSSFRLWSWLQQISISAIKNYNNRQKNS